MAADFPCTWSEIKAMIEALGITDDTLIAYIDITTLHYRKPELYKLPCDNDQVGIESD